MPYCSRRQIGYPPLALLALKGARRRFLSADLVVTTSGNFSWRPVLMCNTPGWNGTAMQRLLATASHHDFRCENRDPYHFESPRGRLSNNFSEHAYSH